jgi:hypothetical protein
MLLALVLLLRAEWHATTVSGTKAASVAASPVGAAGHKD